MSALALGDQVPEFQATIDSGEVISSTEIFGKGPVVIYFYPRDDTPVCTAESCRFRDDYQDFLDAGASVYGVSADSVAAHQAFKSKHSLPFPLISDSGNKLRKLFQVPKVLGLLPGRVTYVFDKSGKLIHLINSSLFANKHVEEALRSVKQHAEPQQEDTPNVDN